MIKKTSLLPAGLFLADVAFTQVALFLALWFRGGALINQFGFFSYHFLIPHLLWLFILFVLDLYDRHFFKKPLDFFLNVLIFTVVALFSTIAFFYFFPVPGVTPKTILLLHITLFSVMLFSYRSMVGILVGDSQSQATYEQIHKKIALDSVGPDWQPAAPNVLAESLKRGIDVVVSVIGLAVTIGLFPLIAWAIVIDSPGGIFYHQERVGKNGRVFVVYKFRSMTVAPPNQQQVTRTGKILRRLHLDELPQAWALLKGDLAFVGPRPEWVVLARTFEQEIPWYSKRYLVKPGIIGWAQINFPPSRSVAQATEKFEYDLYYIKHRSLLMDLEIILKAAKLFFW